MKKIIMNKINNRNFIKEPPLSKLDKYITK